VPFWVLDGFSEIRSTLLERMAGTTRLELATSAVTGQRSNQLNYVPAEGFQLLTSNSIVRVSRCVTFCVSFSVGMDT
jgi:hypothetical protein